MSSTDSTNPKIDPVSQGPWLVKSGERILGPFTTDALIAMVREKEIVVIDEIMPPRGHWKYLRDVPVFQNVVEEIRRGLMHSREDTEVQGYTLPSRTETVITEDPIDDEKTPTKTITQTFSGTKTFADANRKVSQASEQTFPGFSASPVKSVMTPRERRPERTFERAPRPQTGRPGLLIGALILAFAVGFMIYWVGQPHPSHVFGGEGLQKEASQAWRRGEFDHALKLYQQLDKKTPGDPMIAAKLATLLLRVEGQTVEAKRVIESALPNAADADSLSALSIASGLAALQSDDAKEAQGYFTAAGSSWIALFDEGVAEMSLKNWPAALRAFEKSGDQTVSLLMAARAHLAILENNGSERSGEKRAADRAISKAIKISDDYAQEALVMGAYVDLQQGQKKLGAAKVLEAINTDPNQTADHFHDPSLSLEGLSWPKLVAYCRAIDADLSSHDSKALLSICLAKSGQIEDASKLLEGEVLKDSSNPSLQATNAYLNILAGRDDAARASLTLASKSGGSRLAQILSARLCSHEAGHDLQDSCAEDTWEKLAGEAHPPLAALVGLALIRQQKGDREAANALLVKADHLSPAYLPLLRMREEVSK